MVMDSQIIKKCADFMEYSMNSKREINSINIRPSSPNELTNCSSSYGFLTPITEDRKSS